MGGPRRRRPPPAELWDGALRASYRLGWETGHQRGVIAGRREEATAWQAIVTGYCALLTRPLREELARLRMPSNEPCPVRCDRCAQCVRAAAATRNIGRYGRPDYPVTPGDRTHHQDGQGAGRDRPAEATRRRAAAADRPADLGWSGAAGVVADRHRRPPAWSRTRRAGSVQPAAAVAVGLARHTLPWPGNAVLVVYGVQFAVVAAAAALLLRGRRRRTRGRTRADRATRHLSRPAELVGLTPGQVRESSRRLRPGVADDDPDQHGVLLVETLRSHTPLRMSWEDIAVVIAGPRVGKTTSTVVPAIAAYTGPVKTSSNKSDSHDATRDIRGRRGWVWLCDPQDLAGPVGPVGPVGPAGSGGAGDRTGGPAFWWDPLADVTDLAVARELVQIMIDTTVDADAKPDAYFHPTGKATLVNYVFAAALGGRTLLDVDRWLCDVRDTEACTILTRRGFPAAAAQITAVLAKPDRQRDGVLGTAQSWLSVITDPRYAAWITPPRDAGSAGTVSDHTPCFDPARFVRSGADTIYLLSQEGPASAAFVTTGAQRRDRPGRDRLRPHPARAGDSPTRCCRSSTKPPTPSATPHWRTRPATTAPAACPR